MQTPTLIVTGSIALEASINLLHTHKRELEDRFPPFFMSSLDTLPELSRAGRALALIGGEAPCGLDGRPKEDEYALIGGEAPCLLDGRPKEDEYGNSQEAGLFPGTVWYGELGADGIFSSLWRMAEELKAGLRVRVPAIPIRQETIELLELFNLDPYYAPSRGAVLTVTRDPAGLLAALYAAGLPSAPIGILTDSADRLLLMSSHTRYLDRPR